VSTGDFPLVAVWAPDGTDYALVGSELPYEELVYESQYLDAGTWEMLLPYSQAAGNIAPDSLITIDWRGDRTTWIVDTFTPGSTPEGGVTLRVGGSAAISLLARELAWPDPTLALNAQPVNPSPQISGNTETVLRTLISSNWVTRRGETLAMGTNGNLGLNPLKARPKFDNLLELVTRKARRGGVGVKIGLVNSTSVRAALTLTIWLPDDKTDKVYLSEKIGNLLGWEHQNTEPTVTKAIVTGAGGVYRSVTTTESNAAATAWGGHRVSFVQGPASYDNDDLDQAGAEAIDEGAVTSNVEFQAADTPGLEAFRDYNVGDKVTGQLAIGLDVEDIISSINVSVTDGYPDVTPKFGDPHTQEPLVAMAEVVRRLNRRIRLLEQRS
jgi:hypothetical protein